MFLKTSKLITIDRFINEQEKLFPVATGEFTRLMNDFIFALRMISHEVRRAGLNDILGLTNGTNIHGEEVKKIDEYANNVLTTTLKKSGLLAAMISEESNEIIQIPEKYGKGKYIIAFDPLDGSSNIDVNITIGTIFSLFKRKNPDINAPLDKDEILQPGNQQVAAGYVLYGSATMLVYTTGNGVNVFSLDPNIGEFLLIFENVKMPTKGHYYSCNEGNYNRWYKPVQDYINYIKQLDEKTGRPYNFRYVAAAVADIHRTLHNGGIYLYPDSSRYPNGKIRLLYEANPLAMIIEQAGGMAINGKQRILDIKPESIHQRVPFYAGSNENIEELQRFLK